MRLLWNKCAGLIERAQNGGSSVVKRRPNTDKHSASVETDFIHRKSDGVSLLDRAKRTRAKRLILSVINSLLIIISATATSILVFSYLGIITIMGAELSIADRYNLMVGLSLFWMTVSIIIWFRYIFLGGWFRYPPSIPRKGKFGDTREWYHAITNFVQDEAPQIADGLSTSLVTTIRTKIKSAHLLVWGVTLAYISLMICVALLYRIVTKNYYEYALNNTDGIVRGFREFVVGLFGGQISTSISASSLDIHIWALIITILPPIAILFFAFQILLNAFDMRWSLLTIPDVLYKILKHYLMARNPHKDYLQRHAAQDAKAYVKTFGISKHPEEFIGMDGNLFFYSELARTAFLQTHENGDVESSTSNMVRPENLEAGSE